MRALRQQFNLTGKSVYRLSSRLRVEPRMRQQTVAVIGAGESACIALAKSFDTDLKWPGSSGLSMLKTLREDGFKVTCYERRSRVGGLWAYTDDKSMTTALPSEHTRSTTYIGLAENT